MKYLIAIDLDGTLLDKNNVLSDENIKSINEVRNLGHKVVIATGRSYEGAIDIYNKLNLDTPMVIHNGACVINPYDTNFNIVRYTLCSNLTEAIFKKVMPYIISAFYTVGNTTYSYNLNKELELFFNGKNSRNVIETNFTKVNDNPSNLVMAINPQDKEVFESIISNNANNLLNLRIWKESKDLILYEVFNKNISKYTGLKHIFNYYTLNESNLIAFGDNHNDIDMIKNAKVGVAVNNASTELKKKAKIISDFTNNESAIAKFLNENFALL